MGIADKEEGKFSKGNRKKDGGKSENQQVNNYPSRFSASPCYDSIGQVADCYAKKSICKGAS